MSLNSPHSYNTVISLSLNNPHSYNTVISLSLNSPHSYNTVISSSLQLTFIQYCYIFVITAHIPTMPLYLWHCNPHSYNTVIFLSLQPTFLQYCYIFVFTAHIPTILLYLCHYSSHSYNAVISLSLQPTFTNYERFKDALGADIRENPLFLIGTRQEQVIMEKLRMQCSNLNGHIKSMHIVESSACSCGFVNEDEFHFFFGFPLFNRPRIILQNVISSVAPFTLRTLLYGVDEFDFTENKKIINEIYT